MMDRNDDKQDRFVMATLETLMPKDHFLRDLDKYVDFSFIYDRVKHLYSRTGRRSIDPVVLVKMILLGFLYGIDSERKLEREVQVNIAYRWFLGIDLCQRVPDHSTISQTRKRKWSGTTIFEDIFSEIVQKCIDCGLVDGSLILTDTTHVKANASNQKRKTITVTISPREYVQKLNELCETEDAKFRAKTAPKGRQRRGKKVKIDYKVPKTRDIVKSITDPNSGLLARPNKPTGFHYLNHQSICGKSGIITDVHVTAANAEDFEPYADRIKH